MVRFKNRYLLLEVTFCSSEDHRAAYAGLNERGLVKIIKDSVQALHGDYGLACVLHSINVKYMNATTSVAIVRTPRDHYRMVWVAITTITSLQLDSPCSVNIIHIGGTIKSCQRYLIRHNQVKLKRLFQSTTDTVERRKLKTAIIRILKDDITPIKP